jgi:hypothetical protein
MKNIITILFFLFILVSYGQTIPNSKIYISNSQNFDLSPFTRLVLHKKITKYNFVIKVGNISASKYHNKRDAEILGVGEYDLNTALEFTKKNDSLKHYYYPISDNFNGKYFEKEISYNLNKNMRLKFYTTIYKTESNPIVIINCVKLLKNN